MHHSSNNEIIYCDLPQGAIRINDKKLPQKVFIANIEKLKNTLSITPSPRIQRQDSIIFSRLYLPMLNSLGTKAQTPICQNVNIYVAMLNHNKHDPWVSLGCQIGKLKYQEQCWNREKTDKAVKKTKLQIPKVYGDQYCSLHRSKMKNI